MSATCDEIAAGSRTHGSVDTFWFPLSLHTDTRHKHTSQKQRWCWWDTLTRSLTHSHLSAYMQAQKQFFAKKNKTRRKKSGGEGQDMPVEVDQLREEGKGNLGPLQAQAS